MAVLDCTSKYCIIGAGSSGITSFGAASSPCLKNRGLRRALLYLLVAPCTTLPCTEWSGAKHSVPGFRFPWPYKSGAILEYSFDQTFCMIQTLLLAHEGCLQQTSER